MNNIKSIGVVLFSFFCITLNAQSRWENPIQKQERLGSPLVETTPFVFNNKLYLLENNQKFWDVPGAKPGAFFKDDEVRIRDLSSQEIISVPLKNHGFGTALIWEGTVYVFAGNYGKGKPWRKMTEISMTSSKDLKTWTKPKTVLKASENEYFFNTAVCSANNRFVLLYETSDPIWKPFTFRYMESEDLINWKAIPSAIYGVNKYVGGPALYYENGWFYTLYLESLKPGYETRITRSKDLIQWEDAAEDRPFVTFNSLHKNIPLIKPEIGENNASDVELCYFNGETILYFTGSDQTTAGDLQWATYKGTPQELFEYFFEDTTRQSTKVPKHEGDWNPVLKASNNLNDENKFPQLNYSDKPTAQQLIYQERQLGAFIHFGPATYIASDMMSVPAADIFDPSKLDAEQWIKTAKSFGAKHVVLTAKHHNGFLLWPSKTTAYSVKNSPWKNGKGDVVEAFVKACRKYDMKIGLYVSGGDKHFGCTSTPDPQGERKLVGDIHKYFPVFMEQLRELLTSYGKIDYIWFDGAYDPFGWDVMNPKTMERLGTAYGDAIRLLVHQLQPESVIMGGTKPDVRWSGSEQGWAAYPLWNVVKPGEGLKKWVGPHSYGWIPAEANLHTRKTWFWSPNSDETLRDIDYLTNVYMETIGRGANLLINMTPDMTGLIPSLEVVRLNEFGKTLDNLFKKQLGSALLVKGQELNETFVQFESKEKVNLLVIEEAIENGQNILNYKVEAFINNQWEIIAQGESIGRKRIELIQAVETKNIRLSLKGNGNKMFLKSFNVYNSL
jgi:alpha-L-fucosidase